MANKEGKLDDRLVAWFEEAMGTVDMEKIEDMDHFMVI